MTAPLDTGAGGGTPTHCPECAGRLPQHVPGYRCGWARARSVGDTEASGFATPPTPVARCTVKPYCVRASGHDGICSRKDEYRAPVAPLAQEGAEGERLVGFARYSDDKLLDVVKRFLSEQSRDSNTPVFGRALIVELSARLASVPASVATPGAGAEALRLDEDGEAGLRDAEELLRRLSREHNPTAISNRACRSANAIARLLTARAALTSSAPPEAQPNDTARSGFMAGATWHAGSLGKPIDFAKLAEAVEEFATRHPEAQRLDTTHTDGATNG